MSHVATTLPLALLVLRRLNFPHKLGVCERLFGMQLSRLGICWVRCSNGVLWKLDLGNSSHRWCVYGDYEGQRQMDWLRSWLRNGGHVVDSGANIGQMTLSLAPLSSVTVHAFEPTNAAGDWLAECIEVNSFQNIRLIRNGLSSKTCKMPIQLDDARSTLRMDWYQDKNLEVEEISLIALDDYLSDQNIDHVRLWKLDVEGHELQALKGAENSLAKGKIDAILIEVSQSTFEDVRQFLGQLKYRLHAITEGGNLKPFQGDITHNFNLVALPELGG